MSGRDVVHDRRGNPVGGLRPAELDLPLASYGRYRGDDRPECVAGSAPGERPYFIARPLSADEARTLYGTSRRYMARYRRSLRTLVRQGWILQEDVPGLVAAARLRADALLPR